MIAFLTENLATILISTVLLAVVILVIKHLAQKKKSGKSIGCSCGSDSCPNSSVCHKH